MVDLNICLVYKACSKSSETDDLKHFVSDKCYYS